MKYLFLLGLPAMLVSYPMYFIELSAFKRILKIENPEAWDQAKRRFTLSELEVAYRVLSASKDGFFQGNPLSPAVMKARRIAVRWLYLSMCLFMVVLFTGLAASLIEGKQ